MDEINRPIIGYWWSYLNTILIGLCAGPYSKYHHLRELWSVSRATWVVSLLFPGMGPFICTWIFVSWTGHTKCRITGRKFPEAAQTQTHFAEQWKDTWIYKAWHANIAVWVVHVVDHCCDSHSHLAHESRSGIYVNKEWFLLFYVISEGFWGPNPLTLALHPEVVCIQVLIQVHHCTFGRHHCHWNNEPPSRFPR